MAKRSSSDLATLYHGTSPSVAKKVASQGLRSDVKRHRDSYTEEQKKYVYLADKFGAHEYGAAMGERDKKGGLTYAVVKVKVPASTVVRKGSVSMVKGAIPPGRVEKVEYYRVDSFPEGTPTRIKAPGRAKDSALTFSAFVAALLAWYDAQQDAERNQAAHYDLTQYRPRPKAF